MAGFMDSLLAGGWMPVGSGAPAAQFDEYGNPVPVDPPASPFPDVAKKKKSAIDELTPQAGIVAPNVSGQIGAGSPTDYHPDPLMPGTDRPAFSTAERVPMPRPKPEVPVREADGAPSNVPTDISSSDRGSTSSPQAANAYMPPAPAGNSAPAPDSPSIFGRIGNFLQDHSNTLLALGAGFAGAPNIGQGISRASAAAIPASQSDIKNRTLLQSQSSTYRALIEAGVPPNQALGAIGNPELQKALIQSFITDKGKTIQMVKSKDTWGNETEVPYVVNKFPAAGEPVMTPAFPNAAGGASAAPGTGGGTGQAVYAPGVTAQTFDHTKVGDDYLAQLSPEIQASVKNYLAGQSLPTGRQQSAQMIKQIAAKYGADIGMPADDAAIGQRKVWSNSLGNTQSGVGLQAKGFQQGLEHFVKLSDNLVKMNLSNGLGFEPAAGWANWMKSLTTDQQELIHKSGVEGQALAREMGNLFSKNGGGVHEAAETKKNISDAFMSGKAAAGSLEAIDELMGGGLKTLEQRRDELFPTGNAPRGSQFNGPEQQKALEHIRKNIAILKGEARPDAAAATTSVAPPRAGTVNVGGKEIGWTLH